MIRKTSAPEPVETTEPPDLIPLAELVLEGLATTIDQLAADLCHEVLLDDLGRRAVPRQTARRLFAERAEYEERTRTLLQRQQEELARQQEEMLASIGHGLKAPAGLEHLSAAEVMFMKATEGRLDKAGQRYDEYASGALYYREFPRPQQEEE
jgi:hypothetical protein